MHEEDHGILWKHADWRTGKTEVRRSRRLVISMIATVGNYEYGYFWYLYQDGTIEYEVKMAAVISNAAVPPGKSGLRHPGRPPALRSQPPAHLLRAATDMMVKQPQNTGLRVRLGGAAVGSGETRTATPAGGAADAAAPRVRGAAGGRRARRPLLEDHQDPAGGTPPVSRWPTN